MSIYVTGDTHGANSFGYFGVDGFMNRLSEESFPEQTEMTKEDYVIICGDFGGVWELKGESTEEEKPGGGLTPEKEALDWLEGRPFTTLFVPGNHENYDRLTGILKPERLDSWVYDDLTPQEKEAIRTGYPRKEWHGGYVREIRPSVLMLERGYVFDIDGCSCFAFGGAKSHDIRDGIVDPLHYENPKKLTRACKRMNRDYQQYRILGVSWWPQELPSGMEMEMGLCELEDHGNKVDFIFTHEAPASNKAIYGLKPDDFSKYLERVKQAVDYKKWFFGHLHDNQSFFNKDFLLYEQIVRIH